MDQQQSYEQRQPAQPSPTGHPLPSAAGISSLPQEDGSALLPDHWRAALDAMPDLVMLCNEHGTIIYKNAACHALLSSHDLAARSEEEKPAWRPFQQDGSPMPPEDLPLQRALATGEVQRQGAVRVRWQNGEERLLVWNTTPLRDAAGRLIGAIAVGRDMTNDEELTQAREDWLAIAAHDLRSPVTAILGHLQLAQRVLTNADSPNAAAETGPANPQARRQMVSRLKRHIDVAEARTHDLMRRMEAMLIASATREGALSLHSLPGGINLSSIARQAVQHIRTLTTHHTLTVHAPRRPVLVAGDPDLLRQVLDNLLANAVKYTPDGGRITITLHEVTTLPPGQAEPRTAAPDLHQRGPAAPSKPGKQRWALLRVADQGLGIAAADLPSIFERYRRAGATARRVRGTGLGLYTCRAIVAAHHGRIWVESTATLADQSDLPASNQAPARHGTVIAVALPLA
jgi:two-component system phosphate regulon sensor histidine kinase PhoR